MEGLKDKIKEFSTFVTLQKGLLKSTRENYARVMAKVLRDIGTLTPSHSDLNEFMMGLIDIGKASFSHITNNMRAIEAYSLFIQDPITFKRPRKPRPTVGETTQCCMFTLGRIGLRLSTNVSGRSTPNFRCK
jgi:hypothetical protein